MPAASPRSHGGLPPLGGGVAWRTVSRPCLAVDCLLKGLAVAACRLASLLLLLSVLLIGFVAAAFLTLGLYSGQSVFLVSSGKIRYRGLYLDRLILEYIRYIFFSPELPLSVPFECTP